MPNALKKINARVKHLQKLHPNTQRKTLQKQAGREYRAGKLGAVRKSRPKKQRAKKAARKRVVRKVKRLHAAEGRAIKSLGSVSSHLSAARAKIKEQIGWAEVQRFTAHKVSTKRKIGKHIANLKSQYRKLS